MKLFRALSLSALCFLTRHTCAAVPVFEDAIPSSTTNQDDQSTRNQNSYSTSSRQSSSSDWKKDRERRTANFILKEVKRCRDLLPNEIGFLVHIDYSKAFIPYQEDKVNPNDSIIQKRVIGKMIKTWKSMPTDQRLQAVGSGAGLLALPAFLTGAAQAWDAEQIQKIKQKAAEAEVKKKGGKILTKQAATSAMPPPPPPSAFNHVKRDEIMILERMQDYQSSSKEQRGFPSTISKSMGHVHLPSVRPTASHAAGKTVSQFTGHISGHAASHAKSFRSTASSRPISTSQKPSNSMKEPNPTVARVLSWTGAMTSLMYIPAAYQAVHKAQYVTDDDAHAYRRRRLNDEGMTFDRSQIDELPFVTCVPVSRKGSDYIIPKGALHMQNAQNPSLFSSMTSMDDEGSAFDRRGESATLNKAGKHAKMVGIAGMGIGLGWLMHQLNQKRDQDDKSANPENMLTRRQISDSSDSEFWERGFKPGKGSVLTAAFFGGTALSAAGLGVPQLHATVTEDAKAGNVKGNGQHLQKRDQVVFQRRQTIKHQLARAATDKVTMFLATTATAYGAVKTAAASALYNAVVNPNQKPNPPKQHVRRNIKFTNLEEQYESEKTVSDDSEPCQDDDCQFERRSGRKTTLVAAALLGTFLGQRTGKAGQEKENKQYLEQIGQAPTKQRRNDNNDDDLRFVKRAPGKNAEVAETATSSFKPYVGSGAVAVSTLAASLAGRKTIKTVSTKELDKRESVKAIDIAPTIFKRAPGKGGALGKAVSKLARSASKGKNSAIQHTVAESVSITHVHLGNQGNTPHVIHTGGQHHSPKHSSGYSSAGSSSSTGSVRSKPRLQRQSSTASSSSSSPSNPPPRSHQQHRKPKHEPNEHVKEFYRENPDVQMPSRVEEVHRIHHAPSEHHDAPAQQIKKKSSMGKKVVFGAGGAALGVLGHHQYTNAVDAQAQAAQQQAEQAPPTDPAPAPAKRSIIEKRSPQGRRGRHGHGGSGSTSFKVVHQHVFDHHLEPAVHQMKKGGGKKGAIGALLLGAVAGVVGHAMYHNSKANQTANQSQPVDAAAATTPPEPAPDSPPKPDKLAPPASAPKKRNFDEENVRLERRDGKTGGKLASALTGGLAGMAITAYGYAFTHDQPGTRKKHTVPVGTLPQNTDGATKAQRRSINDDDLQREALATQIIKSEVLPDSNACGIMEEITNEKRNVFAKYLNKMTPKQKVGTAIGAGIALSTAAAMVDPGAKEATQPIVKRTLNDEGMLDKRGRYGKKDIAIVSALAGVAGLTGMMKRDECSNKFVIVQEPIYQDIVARAAPKSFQNRAFAIADYATIALMGGTLIKNSVGALSSKAHRKRDEESFDTEDAVLFSKRKSDALPSKSEILQPIDTEYQSFLNKRSPGAADSRRKEGNAAAGNTHPSHPLPHRPGRRLSQHLQHPVMHHASNHDPLHHHPSGPNAKLADAANIAAIGAAAAGAASAVHSFSHSNGDVSHQQGHRKRDLSTEEVWVVSKSDPIEVADERIQDESLKDDISGQTYSRRAKMNLSGPFTHTLARQTSRVTASATHSNHPTMDSLVGKMSMATIAGAITAPVLKSVLGGSPSPPSKGGSASRIPNKRDIEFRPSLIKRQEYSKYIEAVKKEVTKSNKPGKREFANSFPETWQEVKMIKRKATAAASQPEYTKYIEAVKEAADKAGKQ